MGFQMIWNIFLVYFFCLHLPCSSISCYLLHCFCQLPSTAVVQSRDSCHTCIVGCIGHTILQTFSGVLRQSSDVSYQAESYIIFHEYLIFQLGGDKIHQSFHLRFWAIPVLCGECIHGQVLHSQSRTFWGDACYRLHALNMPCWARQSFLLGPSSVTIHDNGYRLRDIVHVEFYLLLHWL